MSPEDAVKLCRYVKACCPQQAIDELTPLAWADHLERVPYEDAKAAAKEITAKQPFVTIAEILAIVRQVRRKRIADAGDLDTWHCPDEPEHWWSERDYRDRVAVDYLQHATELSAAALAERLGVALSTVRKWTARTWDHEAKAWVPARLVSHRRGPDGRKVYAVATAEALRSGMLVS